MSPSTFRMFLISAAISILFHSIISIYSPFTKAFVVRMLLCYSRIAWHSFASFLLPTMKTMAVWLYRQYISAIKMRWCLMEVKKVLNFLATVCQSTQYLSLSIYLFKAYIDFCLAYSFAKINFNYLSVIIK